MGNGEGEKGEGKEEEGRERMKGRGKPVKGVKTK